MRRIDHLNRLPAVSLFCLAASVMVLHSGVSGAQVPAPAPAPATKDATKAAAKEAAKPATKAAPAPNSAPNPAPKPAPKPAPEPKLGPAKVVSKPGLWQTKIVTEMSNGSSGEGGSLVCVLPRDLRTPEVLIPIYSEVGMSCVNKDFKLAGATASWRIVCTGKDGKVEGKGSLAFAAESQRGTAKLEKTVGGKTITLNQKITATLTGPCVTS